MQGSEKQWVLGGRVFHCQRFLTVQRELKDSYSKGEKREE